jgi:hypothetical protein
MQSGQFSPEHPFLHLILTDAKIPPDMLNSARNERLLLAIGEEYALLAAGEQASLWLCIPAERSDHHRSMESLMKKAVHSFCFVFLLIFCFWLLIPPFCITSLLLGIFSESWISVRHFRLSGALLMSLQWMLFALIVGPPAITAVFYSSLE